MARLAVGEALTNLVWTKVNYKSCSFYLKNPAPRAYGLAELPREKHLPSILYYPKFDVHQRRELEHAKKTSKIVKLEPRVEVHRGPILVQLTDLVDGVYPQGTDTYLLAYQIWYIRRTVPLFSQSFLKLWQAVRMIVAVVVEVESLEGLGHSYQTVAIPTEGESTNGPDFRYRKLLNLFYCVCILEEDVLEMSLN
ncbi:hypothetical protein P3S68_002204 [Capsicum galapagoense]